MEIELILTNKCNLHCKQCYTIHGDTDMSSEVLDKAIDFIKDILKKQPDEKHSINFVGGEVGLYNHSALNDIVARITENETIKNVKICCRSNLAFELTDDFIKFAKRCDIFGTSYDYKARFGSQTQEDLWKKNIKILQDNGIKLDCIITINKMLMTLSPEEVYDIMKEVNIKSFDLHRLFYPNQMKDEEKEVYDKLIRPKNRDVDRWLLHFFIQYRQWQKMGEEVYIDTFEAIRSTLHNDPDYTHFRKCQKENRTILPNGMVSQCTYTVFKPFYNLMTGEINQEVFDELIKYEETLSDDCKKCQFVKSCRGDCCWFPYDDTGCPGLKLIYGYFDLNDE